MKQTLLKNTKYEILGELGWEDFEGVLVTEDISLNVKKIKTKSEKWIECTDNHRLYDINDREIYADKLKIGDFIQAIDGVDEITAIESRNVSIVYDIYKSKSHKIYTNGIKNHQCDEFSKIPRNMQSDFFASLYPTLSSLPNSKIIIISTPFGMFDMFHEIYTNAENKRSAFVAYSADWRCVPWHTDEWAEQEKKNVGEERFRREYEVQFIGSSSTVINPKTLEMLFNIRKEPIFIDSNLNNELKIYEYPLQEYTYILGCDPTKGTSNDYGVIQVLKVITLNPIQCEQVATFRSNTIDVYKYAELVDRLSKYYNNAHIMIENNSTGYAVVKRIWYDYENENMYNSPGDLGIMATKKTKPAAVLLMKKLIENTNVILNDADTIKELGSFAELSHNKFGGKDLNDDTVTSLYWGLYAFELGDKIFDDSPGINSKDDEDGCGILADSSVQKEDWSWLTK